MEFDKSDAKFFINYYIEDFKIELKIPLETEDAKDADSNGINILNKLDFSNKVYLVSII